MHIPFSIVSVSMFSIFMIFLLSYIIFIFHLRYYELIPKVEEKSTEESPEEILSRCNKMDDDWEESDDDLDNDKDTLLEIIPKPKPSEDPNQEIGLDSDDVAASTSSVLRFVKIII